MAALRKAAAYSKRKVTPNTRKSKKRKFSYVKTIPPQKIVKFAMGNGNSKKVGKLPYELFMVSVENVQIRSNALEACRQFINKKLEKNFPGMYLFEVKPYPHHIQRENKMLTGAGADRMQSGMQRAFGKSMGRSAIAKEDTIIFKISGQNEKVDRFARNTLKQIKSKLPGKTRILSNKVK